MHPKISDIIYSFVPNDSIIFFDSSSESPERMIFGIPSTYKPFEVESLKQLDLELKHNIVRKFLLNLP